MDTKGLLITARKLIENPKDWRQEPGKCEHRYCAQTAISHSAFQIGPKHEAFKLFADAIGVPTDTITRIWEWNDAPGRKHSEVLAAFDKAISAAH